MNIQMKIKTWNDKIQIEMIKPSELLLGIKCFPSYFKNFKGKDAKNSDR